MPFVSIQLNSNRPEQIARFFDSVENTADKPEDIEVLLHIDQGDKVMEEAVEMERARRKFDLRVLQTDLVKGYATLWKPLNPLFEMTHPEAYFVINLSDEMLFETCGWDSMLKPYVGYYPDHIFRLRGSKYRFRNYTDFWENGFAPDSLAFYTRRWLELSGDWNPCLGPDSFQQCVSYYLFTDDPFSHTQHMRDIPLPHIKFSGEGASIGLEGEALYRRICINNRAWFVLMSHKMQEEARRRAMRMKAHIIAHNHQLQGVTASVEERRLLRRFVVRDANTHKVLAKIPYQLSWLKTSGRTWLRSPLVLYYAGGGRESLRTHPFNSIILMTSTYFPYGMKLFAKLALISKRYKLLRTNIRHPIHHIRGITYRYLSAQWRIYKTAWEHLKDGTPEGLSFLLRPYDCASGLIKALLYKGFYIPLVRIYRMLRGSLRFIMPAAMRRTLRPADRALRAVPRAVGNGLRLMSRRISYVLYAAQSGLWSALFGFTRLCITAIEFPFLKFVSVLRASRRWLRAKLAARYLVQLKDVARLNQASFEPMVSDQIIFVSIQLSSNRPEQVVALLDNIEATAEQPQYIEVLIHIDSGHTEMEELLLREKATRKVSLRYLKTSLVKGFTDLWKAYNPLFAMTDPKAYFVTLFSDEMRFETQGWDRMLCKYIGYYPDHIFRLRGSKYRFRNYTDFWECGFAPDSLAFYTRKWLAIQNQWNPCTGPDSFQQCVAYYLFTSEPFSHKHYQRDVPLAHIKFGGEGASQGLEGDKRVQRIYDNNREWFRLMSPKMQREAKRFAMCLKLNILSYEYLLSHPSERLFIRENKAAQSVYLLNETGFILRRLSYAVPAWSMHLTNALRAPRVHYYAGGGRESLKLYPWMGVKMMLGSFWPWGRRRMEAWEQRKASQQEALHRRRERYNHIKGTLRYHGLIKGPGILVLEAIRSYRKN